MILLLNVNYKSQNLQVDASNIIKHFTKKHCDQHLTMAPTKQKKPITVGKGIGMKHRESKKKLHQKAVKAAHTTPNGKRTFMKKRQKGRKQLSTTYRSIVDINNELEVCDEDDMDYHNDESKLRD